MRGANRNTTGRPGVGQTYANRSTTTVTMPTTAEISRARPVRRASSHLLEPATMPCRERLAHQSAEQRRGDDCEDDPTRGAILAESGRGSKR